MVDQQGGGDAADSREEILRRLQSTMETARSAMQDAAGGTVLGITSHDPGFDQANFLAWVREAHFAIVAAWSSGEPQGVRPYVSDGLYPRLAADIQAAGHAALSDNVDNDNAVIGRVHSDASLDTIVVHLNSHATLPAGSTRAAWTFQRSAQATTPPGGVNAGDAKKCASCGAPFKLDADGDCAYCRAPFKSSATDWQLVDIAAESAASWSGTSIPSISSGRVPSGIKVVIALGVAIGLIGAVVGVVAAVSSSSGARHVNTQINDTASSISAQAGSVESSVLANLPTVPVAPPPTAAPAPSAAARLTLTGSINLSPSDLDSGALILNTHSDGGCLPASELLHAITFTASFDSGATLKGQLALGQPIGRNGNADLANAGAAFFHFVGPTQATADDETWPMPAGQAGLVTITTDGSGGGTLKWESLQSSEPNSNYAGPLSGLLTWTCS